MKVPKRLLDLPEKVKIVIPQKMADELGLERHVSSKDLQAALDKKKEKKKPAKKVESKVVEKLDNMEKPHNETNL